MSSSLKVDAAVASLLANGVQVQVQVVEQVDEEVSAAAEDQELDTAAIAQRVRHYLKANQIQWTRFGTLVLGVSQGRLSILLGKPKPWRKLAPRVRALYQRMQLWMDTKATFGNNPYMKVKKEKIEVKPKVQRISKAKKEKRRKSLFESPGSYQPVRINIQSNQELVEEEEQAVRELQLMREQVVIEEPVVEEVVVEAVPAQQVVALEEIMHESSLNLEEVTLQVTLIKILFNRNTFKAEVQFVIRSRMCL